MQFTIFTVLIIKMILHFCFRVIIIIIKLIST